MVLESTIVCVDNSEYMRNGDFIPTRLQAQQDAINLLCQSKTRSNPENNVGLVTLTKGEVLVTLTGDTGNVLAKLHQVQPDGYINFTTGIRVAHLALKHRLGKNHKMRIVAFVGSPVTVDDKEFQKLAKRLKKEKVNVDIVNFGEDSTNNETLKIFIDTLNGKEGTGSRIVTVASGSQPSLADALLSSPIIQGEDGAPGMAFGNVDEFGVDPNNDPELALALRVSMEEQRARQEAEARRLQAPEAVGVASDAAATTDVGKSEEELELERALAMSIEPGAGPGTGSEQTTPAAVQMDLNSMTEEEQIAFALQMSLQQETVEDESEGMDVDGEKQEAENSGDGDDVMDAEFLQDVLSDLPGVNTKSEAVQEAIAETTSKREKGSSVDDPEMKKKKKDGKEEEEKK